MVLRIREKLILAIIILGMIHENDDLGMAIVRNNGAGWCNDRNCDCGESGLVSEVEDAAVGHGVDENLDARAEGLDPLHIFLALLDRQLQPLEPSEA